MITTAIQTLSTESDFSAALEASQSQPIVLFKHSALCELSAAARKHMQSVTLPVYEVVVQNDRPLSNHIEEYFGIRHETPQVFVLYRGQPTFNASHRRVTADAVHDAASAAQPVS